MVRPFESRVGIEFASLPRPAEFAEAGHRHAVGPGGSANDHLTGCKTLLPTVVRGSRDARMVVDRGGEHAADCQAAPLSNHRKSTLIFGDKSLCLPGNYIGNLPMVRIIMASDGKSLPRPYGHAHSEAEAQALLAKARQEGLTAFEQPRT